ncbi:hypothetical protein KIW84_054276 [Lathyrus oleraceus]|uniref:Reverse transcriptase Ty1/copia-type domain-containing protein n=1 Tax=Pisum sativum TaxID=3888 RepID=A0A9D5AHA0_PEA|nr:hypothetical protein KIW84_054276 [Pisum sativum]
MVKISPQYKIEASLLEVADLEEAWAKEETHEKEEETRMAEDGMKKHQINGENFARVTLTMRWIVGTRENHNIIIARDSGIFKRIVVLSINNMLHLQKEKMIKVYQDEYGVFICQKRYDENILKKFDMYGCKPVDIPLVVNEKLKKEDGGRLVDASMYRSLVRNLFYLTASRPDLMFVASLLSRFMSKPSHSHLGEEKRVLRYVMGTMEHGIRFEKNSKLAAKGYCDSDWAGSVDDMKSTSAEAEYLAVGLATQQSLWLRRILEDIGEKQEGSLQLHRDNKLAIAMAKNHVFIVGPDTLT